jgi:hypothetical protein
LPWQGESPEVLSHSSGGTCHSARRNSQVLLASNGTSAQTTGYDVTNFVRACQSIEVNRDEMKTPKLQVSRPQQMFNQ